MTQQLSPLYRGMRHVLAPLRYREFRLMWVGQTISSMGNSLQAVALPWMVLMHHNSAFSLGLAMLSLALPQALLTLAGGFLVDRLDARTVMLWADVTRVLTASALALLATMYTLHLWMVCSILTLHGTASALFAPAAASIAPRLVTEEHLNNANALSSIMLQFGPFLGYLPAGIIVASLGPAWAYGLNALSYACACVFAMRMSTLKQIPHEQKPSVFLDIQEGWNYLKTLRWFLALLSMDMLLALAAITTNSIGLPLLAKAEHTGVQGLSILLWGSSCGTVAGILLSSLFVFRSHRGLLSISFQGLEAVLMFLVAHTPLLVAACCMCVGNLLNGFLIVVTLSLIQDQERVRKEMLGRMIACWMFASSSMIPLAQFGGGLFATTVSVQTLFATTAGIALLGAILGLSVAALRQLN